MAKLTNAQALELLATKTAEGTKATQELTALLADITTKPKDGADGQTPYIKDGNWWIGEQDTGVKAAIQMPQMPFIFKEFTLSPSFSKRDAMRLQNGEIAVTDMPVQIKLPVGAEFNGKTATVLNNQQHSIHLISESLNFGNNTTTVEDGFIITTFPANKLIRYALDRILIKFVVCIKNYDVTDKVDILLSDIDGVFTNVVEVSNGDKIILKDKGYTAGGGFAFHNYEYAIKRADGSEFDYGASYHAVLDLKYLGEATKHAETQVEVNSDSGEMVAEPYFGESVAQSSLQEATVSGYVQVKEGDTVKRYLISSVEMAPDTIESVAIAKYDGENYKQGFVAVYASGKKENINAEDVKYLSIGDQWGRGNDTWISNYAWNPSKSLEELAKLLKVEGYPDSPTFAYDEIPNHNSMGLIIGFKNGKEFTYNESNPIKYI